MNTVLCLHASSLKQTLICRHILQSRECYSIFIEKSANKQGSPNHDSIPKKKDAGYLPLVLSLGNFLPIRQKHKTKTEFYCILLFDTIT